MRRTLVWAARLSFVSLSVCQFSTAAKAQSPDPPQHNKVARLLRWSQAALVAGASADTISSYGLIEGNPLLGTGRFGSRQVGMKIGITAGALLMQEWLVRKHPEKIRAVVVMNFVGAAGYGVTALHNESLKGKE